MLAPIILNMTGDTRRVMTSCNPKLLSRYIRVEICMALDRLHVPLNIILFSLLFSSLGNCYRGSKNEDDKNNNKLMHAYAVVVTKVFSGASVMLTRSV